MNNKTPDEKRLLSLCNKFGNKTEGVTASFLRKRLTQNNVIDFPKFMKCTIDDFIKFDDVGPEKAKIFVQMQEYWNDKHNA